MQGDAADAARGRGLRRRAVLAAMLAAPAALAANTANARLALAAPAASAAPPAAPAQAGEMKDSRFGLVTHIATRFGQYGQQGGPIDLAAATGAGWVREELRWDWVEHPLGSWDWGFTDEMVQKTTARGLNILGLLGYNNSAQKAGTVNFDYPDLGLWKRYVAAVVNRYKGTIRAWEVWNEPDVPYFWKAGVGEYVTLLRETYATIKAADPTATVMNGACSNLDMGWFNEFIKQGGAQYTDVLAFHPYPTRSSLDNGQYESLDLTKLRDIGLKANKNWWFTEVGWASSPAGDGFGGGVGDERAQAAYMVRQYVQILSFSGLNVDKIFWYNFRNDGTNAADPENNYGLVQSDWRTPKYTYTAYQRMTAHLTGATPQGRVEAKVGPAYRFVRNGTTVDVVWGSGIATLATTAAAAQAYDLLGTPLATSVAGGAITVQLSGVPVFVEHATAPVSTPIAAGSSTTTAAQLPAAQQGRTGYAPGYAGYGR